MHNGRKDSPFERSIPLLRQTIRALSGEDGLPTPQSHRVGTIGDVSLRQQVLCSIDVGSGGVFVPTDTVAQSDSTNACEARLRQHLPERFTDIRGALKFASLALQGDQPAPRAIVLFTDLEEDVPPHQELATADLSGLCVVVFFQITGNAPTKPSDLDRRVQEWRKTFGNWKSKGAIFRHVAAFNATEVSHFIADCARRSS